jgi:hypothetical protein
MQCTLRQEYNSRSANRQTLACYICAQDEDLVRDSGKLIIYELLVPLG